MNKLQDALNEAAEEYCTGHDDTVYSPDDTAIAMFKVGHKWTLEYLAGLGDRGFDSHKVWYDMGYDSEKEPAVKNILEGARYMYNEKKLEITALKLEVENLSQELKKLRGY